MKPTQPVPDCLKLLWVVWSPGNGTYPVPWLSQKFPRVAWLSSTAQPWRVQFLPEAWRIFLQLPFFSFENHSFSPSSLRHCLDTLSGTPGFSFCDFYFCCSASLIPINLSIYPTISVNSGSVVRIHVSIPLMPQVIDIQLSLWINMPTGLSLIKTEIDSDDPNQKKKVCWVAGNRPTERQTLDLENG